jgi:hypothetical protein
MPGNLPSSSSSRPMAPMVSLATAVPRLVTDPLLASAQNPKSEYRNPKQIRISKLANPQRAVLFRIS